MKKAIPLVLLITLLFTLAAGCGANGNASGKPGTAVMPPESGGSPAGTVNETVPETDELDELLGSMSLEEKTGQVFIMSFRPFYNAGDFVYELSDECRKMVRELHIGGVVFFSENLESIEQTVGLIEDTQAAAGLPLFTAIDEEGGQISRLNKSGIPSTVLPTKSEVGAAGDPALARKAGRLIAEEISSLGFNMNFAPVADVNTNPDNPVIGDRAFGADPELVSRMAAAEMEGMREAGVIAVLKHFPGHGDTSADTHTGTVVVEHDRQRLDRVELVPFRKGIEAGAEAIMAAHISVPEITGSELPATLSGELLTDLLRKEMGFDGLIITDALDMKAITGLWSPEEASVRAFEAGADLLLMPSDPYAAYHGLLQAVKSGRIPEERLDASVRRILDIKRSYGILSGERRSPDPYETLNSSEHQGIAAEIRARLEAG